MHPLAPQREHAERAEREGEHDASGRFVADEAVERARTPRQVANLALQRADALPGRLIKARAAGGDAPLMDEIARRGPAPIALIRAEAQTAAGVRAIDPSRETPPDLRPDAAISTASCGFHHPTAPCAEFLTRGIAPGGGVALGPRSICARSALDLRARRADQGLAGLASLTRIAPGAEIGRTRKTRRMPFGRAAPPADAPRQAVRRATRRAPRHAAGMAPRRRAPAPHGRARAPHGRARAPQQSP
jgi:hypothetical protein